MRRHRFDALSFVFGLAFTALGTLGIGGWLDLRLPELRWIAAGLLVLVGIGLLSSGRASRPSGETSRGEDTPPDGPRPDEPR